MSWLEPHWDRVTPVSCLLFPLSLVFRACVALRRAAYRTGLVAAQQLPVPVVVVGNIAAGGTGKTPAVLWLATFLRERGYTPGIVSRGYGGIHRAPHRVAPESDPLAFGDEPVLLARRSGCEVWVGSDRAAAARSLLAGQPACNVLISDDGLQHYRLGRDAEICLIDGARGLGNGWMHPAGPLREPPSRLATVEAIVINEGRAQATRFEGALRLPVAPPQFGMTLDGAEFQNVLNRQLRVGAGYFRGRRLHAVAGIGNPGRFFRHLQDLGLDFVAHPFPDHHPFRPSDIAYAEADAIVMTEKDAVKCEAFAGEMHWVLPVDARIDARFGDLVLKGIRRG